MKKKLLFLALMACASCHSSGGDGNYVYDVPKILAMDARKLPDELGQPFSAQLPNPDELENEGGGQATGNYVFKKDGYIMEITYYYKSGIIESLVAFKPHPIADTATVDCRIDNKEIRAKFNIANIYITNYRIDPEFVEEYYPKGFYSCEVALVNTNKPHVDADSTLAPQ